MPIGQQVSKFLAIGMAQNKFSISNSKLYTYLWSFNAYDMPHIDK